MSIYLCKDLHEQKCITQALSLTLTIPTFPNPDPNPYPIPNPILLSTLKQNFSLK